MYFISHFSASSGVSNRYGLGTRYPRPSSSYVLNVNQKGEMMFFFCTLKKLPYEHILNFEKPNNNENKSNNRVHTDAE